MKNLNLLILLFLLFSCNKNKEQLFIAGSSTVLPIISTLTEDFVEIDDQMTPPIINSGGSAIGFSYTAQEKVNIGMMSRNITKKERKNFPDKKFIVTPIAYDAVIPVVSSEIYNAGVTALTIKQIRQIYNGEIDNWQALGGPNRPILVLDKEEGRGTRQVFMKVIFGDSKAKAKGKDQIVGSNNEEQKAITQSDGAIGMLSLAWLNNDVRPLNIKMENGKLIIASKETIIDGSYPIKRSLDLVTIGQPKGLSKKFIDFILSKKSQKKIEKLGYVSIQK